MITYFKKRTVESVLAALIFLVLIAVTPVWLQWWRIGTDPGLFLEVRQVYVNDAPSSKDPIVLYDRIIKRPYFVKWHGEVQRVEGSTYYGVCSGNGEGAIDPSRGLPNPVTLSWLVGKDCKLPPGHYRVSMVYEIIVPDYPLLTQNAVSNVFEITQ